MATAGKKHLEHFGWGDAEQFHTVAHGDNIFHLFDVVHISTKSGRSLTGEIIYIGENFLKLLPRYNSDEIIKFEEINNISY